MSAVRPIVLQTPKMPWDQFPENRPNKPQSPNDVASRPLPKSPVSSSLDNVVPQMIIRSPRVRLGKFVFSDAKDFCNSIGQQETHAPQQTASLFDHLVGNGEHARWNGEAERLGGLEVDNEFEFGRLHDRHIGGLFAFDNSAGIKADLAINVPQLRTIAHQAAGGSEFTPFVHRRNGFARHESYDLIAVIGENRVAADQQCT